MNYTDPHKKQNLFQKILHSFDEFRQGFPLVALLALLAGVFLIVFPETALTMLIRIYGAIILLYGLLRLFALLFGGVGDGMEILVVFRLLWVLFLLVVGAIFVASPSETASFLAVVAGIYLLVDGAVKLYRLLMSRAAIAAAFGLSIENTTLRVFYTTFCILTVSAGIFLLVYPKNMVRVLAVIAGVALLIEGVQGIVAFFAERAAKRKKESEENAFVATEFIDKTDGGAQ